MNIKTLRITPLPDGNQRFEQTFTVTFETWSQLSQEELECLTHYHASKQLSPERIAWGDIIVNGLTQERLDVLNAASKAPNAV